MDKIIELVRCKDGKPRATADSLAIINSDKKDRQFYKKIGEKKARSLQQLGYYWGNVLRLISEHIDGMESFIDFDDSDRPDYDRLHRYLTLKFAIETNRGHLIKLSRTMYGGEWIEVPYVSFSFDKMKHEDSTAYLSWLDNRFYKKTGMSFDEMDRQQLFEVQ